LKLRQDNDELATLEPAWFAAPDAAGIAMNTQARAGRPATYQDVLDAPPNMVAEIVRGALHLHPRPSPRHGHASSTLGVELGSPFGQGRGGPGGWWILDEPELHLGADVLVPDLAGWRRERMPALPQTAWFDLAPDWACEVLSPGTRRLDLTDKRAAYAAAGVGWLWLVDPLARTLEAFALLDGAWTLIAALGDDAEVRVAPFDAISFPLAGLWAD
jgi:Uma2 family endonuclease